jgi:hypothetical protein
MVFKIIISGARAAASSGVSYKIVTIDVNLLGPRVP